MKSKGVDDEVKVPKPLHSGGGPLVEREKGKWGPEGNGCPS